MTVTTSEPPSPLLALTEWPRALADWGSLPFAAGVLAGAPRGDGHPVLVLPGFGGDERSTAPLRRFLAGLGYDVQDWALGRNMGEASVGPGAVKLIARLEAIRAGAGLRVSRDGSSLGGIMARLVARCAPDAVRQLITLGSPFAGSPKATNLWRAYQLATGTSLDDPPTEAELSALAEPVPVPSTAIWSRDDGVVAWRNCRETAGPLADNIEVHGSHFGLAVNPSALFAIADRLAQPEGVWRPFDRRGRVMVFPDPERQ